MPLTKGEVLEVVGRLLQKLGPELDKEGGLDKSALPGLIQGLVLDLLKEYAD